MTFRCFDNRPIFSSQDDFRLFCGDLGNEVSDEYLFRAFAKYPSILKAKVVRDKKTKKSKGFGFVSFKDPQDYLKAMREMNGKIPFNSYSLPCQICMSTIVFNAHIFPSHEILNLMDITKARNAEIRFLFHFDIAESESKFL